MTTWPNCGMKLWSQKLQNDDVREALRCREILRFGLCFYTLKCPITASMRGLRDWVFEKEKVSRILMGTKLVVGVQKHEYLL